ncbi:MAG TPA: DUF6174 domain-containing protein [Roseiflexaceae bacterium]|nr:DUF6174 domain-containing protein [Roseiflexaceae bacterium]
MGLFRWHHALWFSLGALLLVLVCAVGLWLSPLGLWPQNGLAQARWQSQAIRHYRMTARFSQGWILSGPWTVEVQDDRVIGGVDAQSGAPLSALQLRVAQDRLPVDKVFQAIEHELRTPALNSPRDLPALLARLVPPLRRQLDRCAARMPEVAYDPVLGFPSGVSVYPSPCFPGGGWTVLVVDLTPLT